MSGRTPRSSTPTFSQWPPAISTTSSVTWTGLGMRRVYHAMQSNGGNATFEAARHAPINLVESGPVAGVIGAAVVGELLGERNTISLDIGGTTAKTSLIEGGAPKITTEYKIQWSKHFAGYPVLVPTVDIVEIGAGGGSIAWIDNAGALRVGPVSAGADPGPACYGRGTAPTVTDANLVAGRINPAYFLGGEIPLSVEKARAALGPVGAAFDVDVEQAAMGVIRLADASMVSALELVSVRRGYDPRDFALVAFGGGGGMHAAALMRELRVRKVIIPANPGVFSAWGMLMADPRQDAIRTACPADRSGGSRGPRCPLRRDGGGDGGEPRFAGRGTGCAVVPTLCRHALSGAGAYGQGGAAPWANHRGEPAGDRGALPRPARARVRVPAGVSSRAGELPYHRLGPREETVDQGGRRARVAA